MAETRDDPSPQHESPEEYPLSSDEPLPAVERSLAPSNSRASPVDAEEKQFSLGELLGLVAAMAVLLSVISSVARWTRIGRSPADLATASATVFGFGALASMIILALLPKARRIIVVGWWALLCLYIVTAAAAVLMSQ
jgi:hypothetical protein